MRFHSLLICPLTVLSILNASQVTKASEKLNTSMLSVPNIDAANLRNQEFIFEDPGLFLAETIANQSKQEETDDLTSLQRPSENTSGSSYPSDKSAADIAVPNNNATSVANLRILESSSTPASSTSAEERTRLARQDSKMERGLHNEMSNTVVIQSQLPQVTVITPGSIPQGLNHNLVERSYPPLESDSHQIIDLQDTRSENEDLDTLQRLSAEESTTSSITALNQLLEEKTAPEKEDIDTEQGLQNALPNAIVLPPRGSYQVTVINPASSPQDLGGNLVQAPSHTAESVSQSVRVAPSRLNMRSEDAEQLNREQFNIHVPLYAQDDTEEVSPADVPVDSSSDIGDDTSRTDNPRTSSSDEDQSFFEPDPDLEPFDPEDLKDELGDIQPLEHPARPPQTRPTAQFLLRSSVFTSSNTTSRENVDNESVLFANSVSFLATPQLGPDTRLITGLGGGFVRFADDGEANYNFLNLNLSAQQKLGQRTYAEMGVLWDQLYDASDSDRLLSDVSLRARLGKTR